MCDVAINPFELRRWDVKFTKRHTARSSTSVTITVVEHAESKDELLLSVTPTFVIDNVEETGERDLIPVLLEPATGKFLLHADQGPVNEEQMPAYFERLLAAFLSRL
jgi:hypothetical protein